MSIDNVTIHQGYELPNGTNTLAHDVVRLINALTSIDSDVFLRPLASSSTYVGTTAIALNRASAAQALTGITSIDGSAATLTTSRTLWGQSFNGSANVTGNLTSVGNITGSGAISLTTAAAFNLSLTSGTTGVVSLDSGTTGAINIGTGANTKTITIGSSTGTVQLPTAVTKVGQTSLIQGGAVNVTFPTLAGTLVGSGDTGTVTATMLASTTGTGSTVVLSTLPTFGTTGVRFSGSTSGTTTLLASATASGILTLPAVTGTVVTTGDTGSVTSTMILNGTILDADVNASAAVAGTKISPDFGSQNVTTTGTSTAASFIPSSATVPTNGLYLSAANTLAFSTNSVGKLFINSIGDVNIGHASSSYSSAGRGLLSINGSSSSILDLQTGTTSRFRIFCNGTDVEFFNTEATGVIKFGTNSAEKLRITSAGLVGIGLTGPTYQLELSTDSAGKPSTALWTITSDERIKEDIELADLDLCYEAIKTIPLKRYKWRDDVYSEEQVTDRRKLGWIAQDVEAVFPKAVSVHEFKYNQVFEETIIPAVEEEVDDEGNIIRPAQPERVGRGELISEDIIEDCKDLNADQIYAAMYGAIQKLIAKVEILETEAAQFKV